MNEFKTKLEKDASYAFEWSQAAFAAAAEIEVGRIIVAAMESGTTAEAIKSNALDQALRGARYPARSTSVQSNLMEQEVAAVWAKVYERI